MTTTHLLQQFKTSLNTSSLGGYPDPWQLLRNSNLPLKERQIRLVVHGGLNGVIDPAFTHLAEELSNNRDYPVQIEALTATDSPAPLSDSVWIVPLLLLPGVHVTSDLPRIRNRLRAQGTNATLLPFLGCWPGWLCILKNLVDHESKFGSPVLLHHPLGHLVGQRYLSLLSKILNVPVLSWAHWNDFRIGAIGEEHCPITCSLIRNRQTDAIIQKRGYASLLEIDSFEKGLTEFLSLLP